jgi:hypothetical protein
VGVGEAGGQREPKFRHRVFRLITERNGDGMGRYMLLWLLGVPIPILLLIWAFGGLN